MNFTFFTFNSIISDMPTLIKLKEIILDILFPAICLNCKTSLKSEEKDDIICSPCLSKIAIHTTLFCGTCRARLPENKKICHKNCSFLLGAATDFNDPIRNLIHQLKYQHWKRVQAPIQKIIHIYLENLRLDKEKIKNYIIIPIPLHKNREYDRGFNQAEIIGKTISEKLGLSIKNNLLTRIKETKTQTELKNWDQRNENLVGAFKIYNRIAIENQNIILVDDV